MIFDVAPDQNIAGDRFGPIDGWPILLVHGGGQTRYSWYKCGVELGRAGYNVVSVDLRGHGESDWSRNGDYSIERFAEDLLSVADTFTFPPVVVGASLGGVAALIAQGEGKYDHRRGFSGVVLVDVVPRVRADGVAKILGFMADTMERGFESLEEAANSVAMYLPHRPKPKNPSGIARNLRFKGGRYYWHWDPVFITGTRRAEGRAPEDPQRLEEAAKSIKIPMLIVRGAKSELVDIEAVKELVNIVPHARFVDIVGASHMVVGDSNDLFNEVIIDFLRDECF